MSEPKKPQAGFLVSPLRVRMVDFDGTVLRDDATPRICICGHCRFGLGPDEPCPACGRDAPVPVLCPQGYTYDPPAPGRCPDEFELGGGQAADAPPAKGAALPGGTPSDDEPSPEEWARWQEAMADVRGKKHRLDNDQEENALRRFTATMRAKLFANQHKGGWADCDPAWLHHRAEEEMDELAKAIARGDPDAIEAEAADVANFCLMIADVARRKAER